MKKYEQIYEEHFKDNLEDEYGNINKEKLMKILAKHKTMLVQLKKIREATYSQSNKDILEQLENLFIHKETASHELLQLSEIVEEGGMTKEVVCLDDLSGYLSWK